MTTGLLKTCKIPSNLQPNQTGSIRFMKAILYHANKDIRLENIQEPVPKPGEVKLRITGTSICATDIEEWQFGPLWVQHGSHDDSSLRSHGNFSRIV